MFKGFDLAKVAVGSIPTYSPLLHVVNWSRYAFSSQVTAPSVTLSISPVHDSDWFATDRSRLGIWWTILRANGHRRLHSGPHDGLLREDHLQGGGRDMTAMKMSGKQICLCGSLMVNTAVGLDQTGRGEKCWKKNIYLTHDSVVEVGCFGLREKNYRFYVISQKKSIYSDLHSYVYCSHIYI